jgi:polar amino acid transport system substrate-binding protein
MKRFFFFSLVVFFHLFTVCPARAGLTILTEEFPPYNYTINGKHTGATTVVVREILRRLGSKDTIKVLPWARAYKRLSMEPNVVLFTTARTKERESLFNWVGPLFCFRLGFYARKGSTLTIDSLDAAKKVGSIATYRDDFREQILKSLGFTNLENSNSPESNIRMLVSGRVDLWFFDNIGAPDVAQAAGINPQDIEEIYTYQQHYSYIAISKGTSPEIVHKWQKALDDMKEDGTFWWLTRKWIPSDAIMVSGPAMGDTSHFRLHIYTADSPPSSYDENGRLKGLSVEIVQEILHRIGRRDEITVVPWARGYRLACSGADTMLFATARIPETEDMFAWAGPLFTQHWGFYRWKGSGTSAADFAAAKRVKRIGTVYQDAKMKFLESEGFNNLIPTNKDITNLQRLKHGDIDLWVGSSLNMSYLARKAGISPDRLELTYAFHPINNFIAFSKGTSPDVVRLWQNVLDEMKLDGTYHRICRKYHYEP